MEINSNLTSNVKIPTQSNSGQLRNVNLGESEFKNLGESELKNLGSLELKNLGLSEFKNVDSSNFGKTEQGQSEKSNPTNQSEVAFLRQQLSNEKTKFALSQKNNSILEGKLYVSESQNRDKAKSLIAARERSSLYLKHLNAIKLESGFKNGKIEEEVKSGNQGTDEKEDVLDNKKEEFMQPKSADGIEKMNKNPKYLEAGLRLRENLTLLYNLKNGKIKLGNISLEKLETLFPISIIGNDKKVNEELRAIRKEGFKNCWGGGNLVTIP